MDDVWSNWSPRTDLAIEISTSLKEGQAEDYKIEGIEVKTEVNEEFEITTTHVAVKDEIGSKKMGKPIGTYVTIESANMGENNPECHEAIINILAREVGNLLPKNNIQGDDEAFKGRSILVIGLGNRFATPDTLGPKVAGKVLVTRHLKEKTPELIDESVSSLSSLAPGVMGLTGIETCEIVHGVAKNIKPDCIIAIDALAARNAKRINATIQISDTGISPGAGVGNKRRGINQETIGCPVIAIGVPTVVDAATLVNDTMGLLINSMLKEAEHSPLYDMLKELGEQEKYSLIRETLQPYIGDLFVTPKDIDEVMEYLANIIANGINIAAHPGITLEDINKYSY